MHYFYLTLLVLSLNATHETEVSNLKENLPEAENEDYDTPIQLKGWKTFFQDDRRDVSKDENVETHSSATPLPNSLKNRRLWQKKKPKSDTSSFSDEDDDDDVLNDWQDERLRLKFEAVNSTPPRGEVIHMNSARPWGVACGDPNQHDLPWGSCTLAAECNGEYRIYRGDYFCGRTSFVCCALVRTSYDLYQGLDLSFEHENSLTTDTEDEKTKNTDQIKLQERKKRKRRRRRRKRRKAFLKKKIRSNIQKIVIAIKKLLQKAYRNASAQHVVKSKELREFIKQIKKQYRNDRLSAMDAHDIEMINYDLKLNESMNKIIDVNKKFLHNDTFRDIVVNGTVNREKLSYLQRTDPVLSLFFSKHRRMGGGDLESKSEKIKPETEEEDPTPEKETPKHLEYDLEYGILYF